MLPSDFLARAGELSDVSGSGDLSLSLDSLSYVPLRVRSPYSLLRGMVRYADLGAWCQGHHISAVAVTDVANLFGALDFSLAMVKRGIQPIIGVELGIRDGGAAVLGRTRAAWQPVQLLAQTKRGYENLLSLVNLAHRWSADQDGALGCVTSAEVFAHAEGLIAITGGLDSPLARHILDGREDLARQWCEQWSQHFPGNRLYLGLCRQRWPDEAQDSASLVAGSSGLEDLVNRETMSMAVDLSLPMVALQGAYFAQADERRPYQLLRCIGENQQLADFNDAAFADYHLWDPQQMRVRFADVPECLINTVELARRCSFVLEPSSKPLLPSHVDPQVSDAQRLAMDSRRGLDQHLEKLDWEFLRKELGDNGINRQTYCDRLEFELDVIENMGYAAYFLIVADFVGWARRQNIPVGPGRGSGGGSIVAWCLGITMIDPIRYQLVFERFLNPERVSMPDFDIDFCIEGRDRVVDYLRQRYGEDKVAQIITFGSLGARAVVRDVGRALGLRYGKVDHVCRRLSADYGQFFVLRDLRKDNDPLLKEMSDEDEEVARLIDLACSLEGLYRHSSTHAGGVIISNHPLDEIVPVFVDPRLKSRLVGFNMKMTEASGLVKFDLLGLKTLTVLQKTLDLINKRRVGADPDHHQHQHLTLDTIPLQDSRAFEGLCNGETFAIFQMESPGMTDAIQALKPDHLEDIIAVLSLYRPGPMKNIPVYIERRHNPERVEYPHPLLEPILRNTLGIVIYQEQVLEIARHVAGFSLGRADLFRRAIGKKIRSEMEGLEKEFIEGACKISHLKKKEAESLYKIIASFADYGFNRAHATGYGLISYYTAWLKAYYPYEFMAVSMSLDSQSTDRLMAFVGELRRMKIRLLPPDVNRSGVDFQPIYDPDGQPQAIRYGLAALRQVGRDVVVGMVKERQENGEYKTIEHWLGRMKDSRIGASLLETMVRAGALDSLEESIAMQSKGHRALLEKDVPAWVRRIHRNSAEEVSQQGGLFANISHQSGVSIKRPEVGADCWSDRNVLEKERESFGFYFSGHPLQGFAPLLQGVGVNFSHSELVQQVMAGRALQEGVWLAGLFLKLRSRSIGDRKMRIITINDLDGDYEVVTFREPDSLTSQTLRDAQAIEGDWVPVAVQVRIEKGEDSRVRLRLQALQPLGAYLRERCSVLYLCLGSSLSDDEVANLRQLMDRLQKIPDNPAVSLDKGPVFWDGKVDVAIRLVFPARSQQMDPHITLKLDSQGYASLAACLIVQDMAFGKIPAHWRQNRGELSTMVA